ncbi:hypothetical protein [Verrucomicrobium sp. BvORR106]|uniref:hypothetical protein n=1 Tax=Verrucomicrobium sp. BvORR106 TaxID=1403819 RepID=UPI002240FBB2|nr:hypothetical protein [Verrucomicrobium sp. BvORR106]
MKALKLALAISLALNVALAWAVWRTPTPATTPPAASFSLVEPDTTPPSQLPEAEDLLSPTRTPQWAAPGAERSWGFGTDLSPASETSPLRPVLFTPEPAVSQPYAAPLPPNPHAVPLWERRVPFREGQLERGLYPNLKIEDPPTRD